MLIAYKTTLNFHEIKIPDSICEFVLGRLEVFGNPDLYIGSFYGTVTVIAIHFMIILLLTRPVASYINTIKLISSNFDIFQTPIKLQYFLDMIEI